MESNSNIQLTPGIVYITGLSGSGKTTLGNELFRMLVELGIKNVSYIDGDELRTQLQSQYGYSPAERYRFLQKRIEILRSYFCRNNVVITSAITYRKEWRDEVRKEFSLFMEIFLDCPVHTCIKRDPKGHYKRALNGEYEMFVGITHEYEMSNNPELVIDTSKSSIQSCADTLLENVLNTFSETDRSACSILL